MVEKYHVNYGKKCTLELAYVLWICVLAVHATHHSPHTATCMCVSEMHASTFHFLHALYVIVAFSCALGISHDGWKINETHKLWEQRRRKEE